MAKVGRPKAKADLKLIEALSEKGLPKVEVARLVGCGENTFARNFSDVYDKGRANLRKKLREKQIAVALKGNVAMLIWLGKQYLDQSDKQEIKQTTAMRSYGPEATERMRAALRELAALETTPNNGSGNSN